MNLSAMEMRVMHAALSQVSKKVELTSSQMYEVPMPYICDLIDREASGQLYQQLVDAVYSLVGKKIKIKNNVDVSPRPKVLTTVIVQSAEYDEHPGTIALRFGSDAIPYLTNLNNTTGFTQHSIHDAIAKQIFLSNV